MYASIVFLPLLGAIIAGILSLGHRDRAAELVTVTGLLLSLLFSIFAGRERRPAEHHRYCPLDRVG